MTEPTTEADAAGAAVTDDTPRTAAGLSDSDKLRLLAAWFDMWDCPETDRQAILDDPRNPGKNDVQRDLLRIADAIEAEASAGGLDVEPSMSLHPGQHEFRTVCRLCGEDGMLHVSVITHHERVAITDARLAVEGSDD